MSCDVLSCDELSSVVKWCGAMGWDLMSLWCIVAGCDVTLCGSKWLCGVNWKISGDPNYTDLLRTTKYYKVLLQYYSVLQSTTPVLVCTTKYYSSTSLYYKVLLQYYSVLHRTTPVLICTTKYYSSTNYALQSTTPVLLCTRKYYSSTTLYYKVLLQYYSVLQSTTPVLLCTRKYYSSTTLYYKVLLQYYSVLQSTTPVLLLVLQSTHLQGAKHQRHQMLCLPRKVTLMIDPRHIWNVIYNAQSNRTHPPTSPNTAPATQNDSHEWCPSHMTRHLQCAEQQVSSTNVTKYCACHEKWLASLILVTRETSFTMSGTTGITLQPHQMLCRPRKMTRIIDPRDIWNVIYNARSNRHHPPTSPNTAPATQNDSHDWCPSHMTRHLQCAEQQVSATNLTKYCACHEKWLASLILVTYETSFTMRGATGITLQPHQILRLPRKIALQNQRKICRKQLKRHFQCAADSSMIRPWSEHDPTMKLQNWTRPFAELTFPPSATHFVLKITTFRAPAIYPDFTEYCACHKKWRSKITKYCACHEKWHSKITKYCACHAKWLSWLMSVTHDASFTMRGATDLILQHHQMLCLPRKMTRIILVTYETSFTMRGATCITFQPHQMLPLPRKMMRITDCRDICNVIYNARSNRHHPPTSPNTVPATQNYTPKSKKNLPKTAEASIPMRGRSDHDPTTWTRHLAPAHSPRLLFTLRRRILYWKLQHFALRLSIQISPNTAPATKNDAHHWLSWHMKRHLQCAEQQASPANLTKYCACHEKWLASLILVTYETSFTMRGATGITLQPHQILRLPRKSALQNLSKILRQRLKRQFQCAADSTMIRAWSEHDPSMNSSSRTRPFAEVTFPASERHFVLKITTFRAPAIYSNFTEYCACHEKWHSDITKCCACHEEWHSDITKYCACHEKWHWTVTWLHSYLLFDLNCVFTKLLLDWAVWAVTSLLLLYWAVTLLSCYFTEVLLSWAVTLLGCYFTELLLDWSVTSLLFLDWAVTLLSCYFAELLLSWAVNLLSCYFTELLLHWAVTLLSCFFTELFLYWAVTLLSCYFTELLLDWTVTWLSCYFTELLLYWAVTLLSCYFTELLLYWAVALLNCYCIFKSP